MSLLQFFRVDALPAFVAEVGSLLVLMDSVTMFTIQSHAKVDGGFIIRHTEIRYVTVPSANILSQTKLITASLYSSKVGLYKEHCRDNQVQPAISSSIFIY